MFEVWDTAMMLLCVTALTAAQPGITLGLARWKEGAMQHPFWRSHKSHQRQGRDADTQANMSEVGVADGGEIEKMATAGSAKSVDGSGSEDGGARDTESNAANEGTVRIVSRVRSV